MTYVLPALATCLALLLYEFLAFNSGRMRARYAIAAPATVGHPVFERAFRVHQNTLEQLAFFLPSLWLFAAFISPLWAGVLGLVWVLARAYYAWCYYRDPTTRRDGFLTALAAALILFVGSVVGVVQALVRSGI